MQRKKQGKVILIPNPGMIDIKRRIPAREYQFITKIGKYSDEFGINAYLVGGFVRDLILGRKNIDIDIVVEGDGIGFTKFLAGKFKAAFKCFENFKTGKIFFGNKYNIDITSARRESYKYPAALPDVEFADLKHDLYRRDFTINAMAIRINKNKTGNFIDPFNGYADLKNGIIRVLHSRSFMDDPTRILRAIRFEKRFGFRIENYTLRMLKRALTGDVFDKVPGERLRDEILFILKEQRAVDILRRGNYLGVLNKLYKGLKVGKKTEKIFNKISFYARKPVFKNVDLDCVRFMVLFCDLNSKQTDGIVARLKFKNEWKNKFINAVKYKRYLSGMKKGPGIYGKDFMIFLNKLSLEELFYFSMIYGNYFYCRAKEFLIKYSSIKPEINGNDLKKIGLKQGPVYGKILKRLTLEKICGKIKSKKQELKFVEKYLKGGRNHGTV